MRSQPSLRQWVCELLPRADRGSRQAARHLLRSLLVGFTTNLSQLARQLDRATDARGSRQYLSRWLNRPHWDPSLLYAGLTRQARRALTGQRKVLVLVDFTYLQQEWAVLQVSIPWQKRALPLYRAVIPRTQAHDEKGGEALLVRMACDWLAQHLPGDAGRYVLVMDRGIPSHRLLRHCHQAGFGFVFRLRDEWKVTHGRFHGTLGKVPEKPGLIGEQPQLLRNVQFGNRGQGRYTWSQANLVLYQGPSHREPWFLATSGGRATTAVAIYRQRMRIEAEFRDLKGRWGLDELAEWRDVDRVARFLAWVAAYEWWLALLWLLLPLDTWARRLQVKGRLSWIRVAREWALRSVRLPAPQLHAYL
jgi:DDE family transposase